MKKSSIRLLKQVSKGIGERSRLGQILGISESHLNLLANDLISQNYLNRDRGVLRTNHNPKYALFSKVAEQYDVQILLHDSNEAVLCNMTEPATIKEMQDATGLSLRTVQRAVSDFDSVGIVRRNHNRIHIRQDRETVLLFAKYLKTEKELSLIEPDSEIIYQDSLRVLKKAKKGKKIKGELTGFSMFWDYGIEYHTTHDYYARQDSPLRIEEVLVHAIVAAVKDQNKSETTMCVLFYLRNRSRMDTADIRLTARLYSVSDVWLDIEGYIRNNPVTNNRLFLPRAEFEEKARLYNMPPELYTLPNAYPELFEEVGDKLAVPVDAYLFGGENMRKKGIKQRTKDCDIVVTDLKHEKELVNALEKIGYASINRSRFTEDDNRTDPFDIFEHPARSRVDLFKTRIAKKLLLSDGMIKRATHEKFGRLNLYTLCNEDLFLLKAVTSREGDIQDMGLIVRAGEFEWETVWEEIIRQEHDTKTNFSSQILESLDYLQKQAGIPLPWYKRLIKRALDNEIKGIIREETIPLEGIIELLEGGDITEKAIRNRIDYLQRTNYLTKVSQNNKVFIKAKRKIGLNVYSKNPFDSNVRIKKYIMAYSKQIRPDAKTTQLALEYADRITNTGGGVGRRPSGLAAAVLYAACMTNGNYTKRSDFQYMSGMSQQGFGNLYRLVRMLLKL